MLRGDGEECLYSADTLRHVHVPRMRGGMLLPRENGADCFYLEETRGELPYSEGEQGDAVIPRRRMGGACGGGFFS